MEFCGDVGDSFSDDGRDSFLEGRWDVYVGVQGGLLVYGFIWTMGDALA